MAPIRYGLLSVLVCSVAFASASHRTRSYTKKNGTHVEAHVQTNANHTKADNWSTKGNVNPHTGKKGTK